ncbi:hypothetical protein IWQ60_007588 [Tieghemiomyces parasiticus]|uniref:F-box domain-containing protein n=1 Tax=Tieghemiomyces parasiticus TaxID=78921 RepID=A0A9W7ZWM6_9FUNG|nr:hypothetical protein IWQ60_007588 [Tieghemiomyces parasiticus]
MTAIITLADLPLRVYHHITGYLDPHSLLQLASKYGPLPTAANMLVTSWWSPDDPDFCLGSFSSNVKLGRDVAWQLHSFVPNLRAIHAGAHRIPLKRTALAQLRAAGRALGYAVVSQRFDFLDALIKLVFTISNRWLVNLTREFLSRRELEGLLLTVHRFGKSQSVIFW